MDFIKHHRAPSAKKLDLTRIPTETTGPFADKDEARKFTAEKIDEMRKLQYRLFVEGRQSLLIVLQARDAGGKDGLIRKVLGRMNPQGCRTYPFKVPTEIERAHDFLWRVHACAPAAGQVSIFNRSHYEDVLVVRVQGLVEPQVLESRYDQINAFESLLAEAGTTILKFYLHISPHEQLERFKARLEDPEKHWKLNEGDYEARDDWEDYRHAYEAAIGRCNPDHAPWFIIPSDRKWYRDASVAAIVEATLKRMDPRLPPVTVDLDRIRELYRREEAEQAAAAGERDNASAKRP